MISNSSWSLANFRLGLADFLRDEGHDVALAAPRDDYTSLISGRFRYIDIAMNGTSVSPAREMRALFSIGYTVHRENPDVLLLFTPKPNIYGGIAARLLGVKTVHNVAGLGRVFIKPGSVRARLTTLLYRLAMRRSHCVLFQNDEDRNRLVSAGAVLAERSRRIFGSGVDVERFHPRQLQELADEPHFDFLLLARMLKPKGISEYAEAARLVKRKHPTARFGLLGPIVSDDPAGLSEYEIRELEARCGIEYLGETDDVRTWLSRCSCVVLPSYYGEGVPRSLLEAAAMGLPIITTNSVGCRDVVEDGVSGWLVTPRSVDQLVCALYRCLELTASERSEVGRAARIRATSYFDEKRIFAEYQSMLAQISEAVDVVRAEESY